MAKRTKQILKQEVIEMLKEMPLEEITVTSLTARCRLSRMTFYYHFTDINDLLDSVCMEDAKKMVFELQDCKTWQDALLGVLQHLEGNGTFILNICSAVGREQLSRYLIPAVGRIVSSVVEKESRGIDITERDRNFLSRFYRYALIGIIMDWIEGGMKEDPVDLIEKFNRVVSGNVRNAAERFSSKAPVIQ